MLKCHRSLFVIALLFLMLSLFTACDNNTEPHHEHEFELLSSIPATCKEGEEKSVCKSCGYEKTVKLKAIAEHEWDTGQETVPSTYGTPGEIVYTCTECHSTRTEIIEALSIPIEEGSLYFKIGYSLNKPYDRNPITVDKSKLCIIEDGKEKPVSASDISKIEFKVTGESDDTYTETAPINAGDYTLRITVVGKPAQEVCKFAISPRNINAELDFPIKVLYDIDKVGEIEAFGDRVILHNQIPEILQGDAVMLKGLQVVLGDAGRYQATWTESPNPNYNVDNLKVWVTIEKAVFPSQSFECDFRYFDHTKPFEDNYIEEKLYVVSKKDNKKKEIGTVKIYPYNAVLDAEVTVTHENYEFAIIAGMSTDSSVMPFIKENYSTKISHLQFFAIVESKNYTLDNNLYTLKDGIGPIGQLKVSPIYLKNIEAKKQYDGSSEMLISLNESNGVLRPEDEVEIHVSMDSKKVGASYKEHEIYLNRKLTEIYVAEPDQIQAAIEQKDINFVSNGAVLNYIYSPYYTKTDGSSLKKLTYEFGERNGVVVGDVIEVDVTFNEGIEMKPSRFINLSDCQVKIKGTNSDCYKLKWLPEKLRVVGNVKDATPISVDATPIQITYSDDNEVVYKFDAVGGTQYEIKLIPEYDNDSEIGNQRIRLGVSNANGKHAYCKDSLSCTYLASASGGTGPVYITVILVPGSKCSLSVTKK